MTSFSRNFSEIDSNSFDLLVVGGGIVGLGVAEEAARRGLKTLLCEAGDFGGATSSGCFRLVHGGMRYLQHLDFGRMFGSVKEQLRLMQRAPHLIKPISFLIPCYGQGKEGRWLLEAGMGLYELLTTWPLGRKLPRHGFLSREELLRQFPGVPLKNQAGLPLTGAMRFWDAQMNSSDRLTLAVGQSAAQAGAWVKNYAEVTEVEKWEAGGFRALIRDRETQTQVHCFAKGVVNAAGPWARGLLRNWFGEAAVQSSKELSRPQLSKGFQLVLPQLLNTARVPVEEAIAISSPQSDAASTLKRGKRSYFFLPWNGYTLLGTTDEEFHGEPSNFSVTRSDVQQLLSDVARAYSRPEYDLSSVHQVFGGLLPTEELETRDDAAPGGKRRQMRILRDDVLGCDWNSSALPRGFLTVIGVKYTTYRKLAEQVVDIMETELRGTQTRLADAFTPLVGGEADPKEVLARVSRKLKSSSGGEKLASSLVSLYGTKAEALAERILYHGPEPMGVAFAQAELAVREEGSMRLSDIVFRRTLLGAGPRLPRTVLDPLALYCQSLLGWGDKRREQELEAVYLDNRFSFLEN